MNELLKNRKCYEKNRNNKYYKICSEKYKQISNSLIKKFIKSKIYYIGNKFYPLVFIANSNMNLPLIYYICFKKR